MTKVWSLVCLAFLCSCQCQEPTVQLGYSLRNADVQVELGLVSGVATGDEYSSRFWKV